MGCTTVYVSLLSILVFDCIDVMMMSPTCPASNYDSHILPLQCLSWQFLGTPNQWNPPGTLLLSHHAQSIFSKQWDPLSSNLCSSPKVCVVFQETMENACWSKGNTGEGYNNRTHLLKQVDFTTITRSYHLGTHGRSKFVVDIQELCCKLATDEGALFYSS